MKDTIRTEAGVPGSRLSACVVGALMLLCASPAHSQSASQPQAVTHLASLAPGSILGTVSDDRGVPVAGAIVSALGSTTAVVTTDRAGRFELRTLTPGPYLVRAHLSGYIASRGQVVDVRSSARSSSTIALRRAVSTTVPPATLPVLTAGLGPAVDAQPADAPSAAPENGSNSTDSHSEIAWRLRHARRGILKDVDVPEEIVVGDTPPDANVFGHGSVWTYVGGSARAASNFFTETPFSGQVNLLTTGSFESPQQLFSADNFARSIAYMALGAPIGDSADWTVRAALTQGDIASWIVAGEYTTRAPARHRYDLGWSYATQRYDGGNVATLRDLSDGSRNAGLLYGYDTFSLSPRMTLTYGARYARYDYVDDRSLLSPRVSMTVEPIDHFRISGVLSSRAVAPGAEEFVPRNDAGVWLPPQRTFASLDPTQPLQAERTNHVEVEMEHDIAAATVSVRAFRQHVDDQIVTIFGLDGPGIASSQIGHYFIGNAGDLETTGLSAGIRASIAGRVHGSVEWTTARGRSLSAPQAGLLYVVAPDSLRTDLDRVHDVATTLETEVPETSTRVLVLYRVSNAYAHPAAALTADKPSLDARFDVQVRQSLPFMDFSTAKWEMLVGVRNFFREAAPDQSVFDELLVVRPPKRVVGGLTLKF